MLAAAALIAARDSKPFPTDLAPLVDGLEAWDIGAHRVRHINAGPADCEWELEPVPQPLASGTSV